jgi:pimeloyl-ACP methyl ester carboxylesterase
MTLHNRRRLLTGALALGGACLLPKAVRADADDQMQVTANDGRAVTLTLWRPQRVRAAVVFSHGSGGRPQNYQTLMSTYRAAGLLVAAPLHVDSLDHPLHDRFDRVQRFFARQEDVTAALAALQAMAPEASLAVSGHSFGGLMALVAGGGFPPSIPGPLPSVEAVVAFSSAGRIANVVNEYTYAGLTTPTLMVTGDQDVVDPIILDWHEHLYPFETSPPGDKMALVYAGGTHNLIGGGQPPQPNGADAMAIGADYILAYAAHDAAAAARVAALQSNDVRQVMRR